MHPWSMVQDRGFVRLYKKRFPQFELASPKFYASLLDPAYSSIKETLKKQIHEDKPINIAISLDGWSQYHNNYLGVNGHYINDNWQRKLFNICCVPFNESHTAENIWSRLKKCLRDWDILQNTKIALRDNASNMVATFFQPDCSIKGFSCLTHTIQLVIKDEVLNMNSVKKLLKKCRDLCSFANRSTGFYAELKLQQFRQMGLKESEYLNLPHSDTKTWWNSTYYLVERILKLQPAIECTLVSKIGKEANIQFFQSDWDLMEKLSENLAIFKKATKLLQYKDASISD